MACKRVLYPFHRFITIIFQFFCLRYSRLWFFSSSSLSSRSESSSCAASSSKASSWASSSSASSQFSLFSSSRLVKNPVQRCPDSRGQWSCVWPISKMTSLWCRSSFLLAVQKNRQRSMDWSNVFQGGGYASHYFPLTLCRTNTCRTEFQSFSSLTYSTILLFICLDAVLPIGLIHSLTTAQILSLEKTFCGWHLFMHSSYTDYRWNHAKIYFSLLILVWCSTADRSSHCIDEMAKISALDPYSGLIRVFL